MASVFTRIIEGELPGRFVWADERCVAFLTIAPLQPGHTLVVPRTEIDLWTDTSDDLLTHVTLVSKRIGAVQAEAFGAPRSGMVIAGLEVPHLHIHVFPAWQLDDFDFKRVDHNPDPADLDAAAEKLRSALRAAGHGAHVAQ